MPKLSIFFIRTSVIYFFTGVTIGAIMLADKGLVLASPIWTLRSAHIEITLLGWIIQLVMGTAYWILPRHPVGPPRGYPVLAWLSFYLLNAGIILGVLSSWFTDDPSHDVFSRLLQLAGITCFAIILWPRVFTFRKDG